MRKLLNRRIWKPEDKSMRATAAIETPMAAGVNDKLWEVSHIVTLLHGDCEAHIGAGAALFTQHGSKWLARNRAYD